MDRISRQMRLLLLSFALILMYTNCFSQGHSSKAREVVLHHEIDVFLASTHIPKGALDDSGGTLIIPNIGLNYKYWFDERFAIGWYNNIAAITYVVNSDTHQDLNREYPFITSIVGVFRPWKGLHLFAGPGLEIDKNKSLFVFRFGVDYGFSVGNDWYLSPRFMYDVIGSDISAYSLGLSIGRKF